MAENAEKCCNGGLCSCRPGATATARAACAELASHCDQPQTVGPGQDGRYLPDGESWICDQAPAGRDGRHQRLPRQQVTGPSALGNRRKGSYSTIPI